MPEGKRLKSDFRLIGLSKRKSFTCSTLSHKEDIFWPEVAMAQDRFDALWDWVGKGHFWEDKWIAEIEHDGLYDDGTPINPVAVAVREWDLPH